MALSPWHVAPELSDEEVATLLSGYRTNTPGEDFFGVNNKLRELKKWQAVIIGAAQREELQPYMVWVLKEQATPDPEFGGYTSDCEWENCLLNDVVWQIEATDDLRLTIKRQEVYRWLKASGIADADIPEALRVMPGQEAPATQAQAHPTEGEELRAMEALGLLVETFAKGRNQFTHERSGKPNCAQIAEAMSQQAGNVYGMSKSKVQRMLSEALTSWQEKCK